MKRKPAFALIAAIFLYPFASRAQTAAAPQAAETHSQVITMTNILANVEKAVDAKKAKAGDPITARTTAATQLNDGTRVPPGSILVGHIESVTPSEKKSDSTMVVTFDKLQIKDGKELAVKATLLSITTTAAEDGDDKPYDPSSYRAGSQGDNKANGSNSPSTGPHPIAGLTVTSSPKDAASGTLTQAKKNVHLSSGVQLVVSVASIPPGAILQ